MEIKSAEFVISNSQLKGCPEPDKPEYAFIGRSNVGKSSLINMLTNNKNLAKTSSTPGKTQLINHFIINNEWYLVDLPGYGYAKTSKTDRVKWMKFTYNYLEKRDNLMCVMVLLDSRHTPQKSDLEFMEWLGKKEIPFAMVFTKIDKLSSSQFNKNMAIYKKRMLQTWEFLPPIYATSAQSNLGKEHVLNFIEKVNKNELAS